MSLDLDNIKKKLTTVDYQTFRDQPTEDWKSVLSLFSDMILVDNPTMTVDWTYYDQLQLLSFINLKHETTYELYNYIIKLKHQVDQKSSSKCYRIIFYLRETKGKDLVNIACKHLESKGYELGQIEKLVKKIDIHIISSENISNLTVFCCKTYDFSSYKR
ncbi:hypothetical protein COBT_003709 [Conglomerata obtusa]